MDQTNVQERFAAAARCLKREWHTPGHAPRPAGGEAHDAVRLALATVAYRVSKARAAAAARARTLPMN